MPKEFPVLEGKIVEKGYKKRDIAKALGIKERAFYYKCGGKTEFTWNEVVTMQREFFPECSKEELMRRGE